MHFFLRIFDELFSGFRAKFQKIVTCVAFSIKFAKTNQKFAENSEFCEDYSLLFKLFTGVLTDQLGRQVRVIWDFAVTPRVDLLKGLPDDRCAALGEAFRVWA